MTPTLSLWYNIYIEKVRKGSDMKNYDIAAVRNIVKNTCEKHGFQCWEVQDCHFIVWSNAVHHKNVVSIWIDELCYVEVVNRFTAESFKFDELDYPYDSDLGRSIYGLLD